jgi:hypothetical protein
MKDSQFGFQYSTEDLQPIRPLFTTTVIVQVIGALLGFWLAPFPTFQANVIAGGFSASFPGFLVGLLVQRRLDPAALQDNRVMVRRMGLIVTGRMERNR